NEARTRDPNLGKVVLYQLSYFRSFYLQKHSFNIVLPCQGWITFLFFCGKVVLYQLSYFRIASAKVSVFSYLQKFFGIFFQKSLKDYSFLSNNRNLALNYIPSSYYFPILCVHFITLALSLS
ncbi:MAG: hypothetical protein IJZ22_08825, partial [Bacteroidaceae bacterium]|nr:hypothetical protein [Bacteroidaceae bacterium]